MPTQPPSALLCGQRWSSSALLSIPPLRCSSSAFSPPNPRPVLRFQALSFQPTSFFLSFFFHSRYSPLFFSGVAAHLLLSIPCDLCCCSWWIPMIQRFREQGARQSPLSCGWAICLCQTSPPPPIHATWARQWTRGRGVHEEEKWWREHEGEDQIYWNKKIITKNKERAGRGEAQIHSYHYEEKICFKCVRIKYITFVGLFPYLCQQLQSLHITLTWRVDRPMF